MAIGVLAAWFSVTWHQAAAWKNSITLYEHTLSVARPNYVIEHNLAAALCQAGQPPRAKAYALAALTNSASPNATHLLSCLARAV